MDSVGEEATLALSFAEGCSKILAPLLRFLGDEAAMSLLVVLTTAYLTGVIDHFAAVVLAYFHLTATTPSRDLARFVVLFLAFISAWLFLTAAFYFLARR